MSGDYWMSTQLLYWQIRGEDGNIDPAETADDLPKSLLDVRHMNMFIHQRRSSLA